jgi:hypothetical protein
MKSTPEKMHVQHIVHLGARGAAAAHAFPCQWRAGGRNFGAEVTVNNYLAADTWTATVVLPPVADGSAQ